MRVGPEHLQNVNSRIIRRSESMTDRSEARPIEGLPIPLQQGDNDASSLLQALVVYLKLAWRLARF